MSEHNQEVDEIEEEFEELEKPRWLAGFRLLILAAGLLLLGGILLFSGVFFSKAQNYSKHMDAQFSGSGKGYKGHVCEPYAEALSLGGRGGIVGIQLTARFAHATLQTADGNLLLLTLDRCSGDVVAQQRLTLGNVNSVPGAVGGVVIDEAEIEAEPVTEAGDE